MSEKLKKNEVLTRHAPLKIRKNCDPLRPDPRVHPTPGQLWPTVVYVV